MDFLTQIHPILPGFSCVVFAAKKGTPPAEAPAYVAMTQGYQDIYIINLDFVPKATSTGTAAAPAAAQAPALMKRTVLARGTEDSWRYVQTVCTALPAPVTFPPATPIAGATPANAAPTKIEFTPEVTEHRFLPAGKVPITLLDEVKSFFRSVIKKFGTTLEAMIWIMWHKDRGYYLHVPKQSVAGASAAYDWQDLPSDGSILVVDIHSHANFGAFFSGTDDRDDSGSVRISGVIGFNDTPEDKPVSGNRQIWRFNCFGTKIPMQVDDVFYVPPRMTAPTPDEWLDKVTTAPALTSTTYPFTRGYNGGTVTQYNGRGYGGRPGSTHRPVYQPGFGGFDEEDLWGGEVTGRRGGNGGRSSRQERRAQRAQGNNANTKSEGLDAADIHRINAYLKFRESIGTPIYPSSPAWQELWDNGAPANWNFTGDAEDKASTIAAGKGQGDAFAQAQAELNRLEAAAAATQGQRPPTQQGPAPSGQIRTLGPNALKDLSEKLVKEAKATAPWSSIPDDYDWVVAQYGLPNGNAYAVLMMMIAGWKDHEVLDAILPHDGVDSLSKKTIDELVVALIRSLPERLFTHLRDKMNQTGVSVVKQ